MYTFLRRSEDMMIEGAFGKAAEIAITATSKIEKRWEINNNIQTIQSQGTRRQTLTWKWFLDIFATVCSLYQLIELV